MSSDSSRKNTNQRKIRRGVHKSYFAETPLTEDDVAQVGEEGFSVQNIREGLDDSELSKQEAINFSEWIEGVRSGTWFQENRMSLLVGAALVVGGISLLLYISTINVVVGVVIALLYLFILAGISFWVIFKEIIPIIRGRIKPRKRRQHPEPTRPISGVRGRVIRSWVSQDWQDDTGEVCKTKAMLYELGLSNDQSSLQSVGTYGLRIHWEGQRFSYMFNKEEWEDIYSRGSKKVVALDQASEFGGVRIYFFYFRGDWFYTERRMTEEEVFTRIVQTRVYISRDDEPRLM